MKQKKAQEEQKSDEKSKKIAELTEHLQRLAAEFENYQKRVQRDIINLRKYATEDLIKKILPLVDNLELATKNCSNHDELVKGMKLIYEEMIGVLEREGVTPIEVLNKEFDPYKHEAVMQEKSDRNNIVLEEFQKGYLFCDKVLRHSKVKVGKKEEKKEYNSQKNIEKKDA